MDLALALGMTVQTLEQEMSAVEFGLWQRYAAERMLPWRRMELYLAQVAQIIARTVGGNKEAMLSDFVFDSMGEEPEENAAAAFGFSPRKKKEQ